MNAASESMLPTSPAFQGSCSPTHSLADSLMYPACAAAVQTYVRFRQFVINNALDSLGDAVVPQYDVVPAFNVVNQTGHNFLSDDLEAMYAALWGAWCAGSGP